MPRLRFERAAPEVRAAVLDAAAAEFAAQGYEGAALNRILASAKLSKGAFYYYFDDKADLAAAVLQREMVQLLAGMGDVPAPATADDFWTIIERVTETSLAQMRERPQYGDLIGRLGLAFARDPELRVRFGPMFDQARQWAATIWKRGQEVGAVRRDIPVGVLLAIIEAMKMAAAAALLPADRAPTADDITAFTRLHLDLVRRVVEPREVHP